MDSALPAAAAALLRAALPQQPVVDLGPTTGGFSNLSRFARVGRARCVLKLASSPVKRADLRREAHMLALVAGHRVGAPPLVALVEDARWTILITRRRPGTPGVRLYGEAPEALGPPLAALGGLLARLHRLKLAPPSGRGEGLLLTTRATALLAQLDTLPLPVELAGPLQAALQHPAWRPGRPYLVHGDAGLHNLLWGRRCSLLDWELGGWGDPRLDLAWVAWTLRFRGVPAEAWEALLRGYGAGPARRLGLDDEAMHALALGQVAALLARAAGTPAWDEWLRRAVWSVGDGR